ncbi:Mitochondrial substrate carrier family protein N [Gracilariopsis chorda]|uniref:Mitochondrial substrate carrier family protein N n=1 Tax=Gracilariopsis chorda TaxID=448386 RepID=A0A2V3IJZ1_9FLOR|nr:Mitochondrial substrate carrier family protein N [Gracilariopsis chorda]|eukprot:PXF42369.1 Mitochondrial substrate carrier family protein N [Gracilariopsis chorda]
MSTFFLHRISHLATLGHISLTRFFQFFLAGGICAFLTHAACTPIDVVKTRIQTMPGRYSGMTDGFTKIVAEEGAATLLKGLAATAGGYFLHGAFKYSFYELFKLLFSADVQQAVKPPLSVAAISGFFAECIACILLCPMEAIRIRSVSDASFPAAVIPGLSLLLKAEGLHGWYKGLPAMLLKQVPYTVGQFASFELSVNLVKRLVEAYLGAQTGSSAVASISSFAGLLAGITAAVISHPGDTILSRINQQESEGSAVQQIVKVARAAGFWGLFTGLLPRLVQVSCMIGGQFLIYDSIKLWCGIVPAAALPADPLPAVAKAGPSDVGKDR